MVVAWTLFLVSGAIVFIASRGLVKASDEISDRTGISRTFAGLLLLAIATSLPEVATGATAVSLVGSVDLAAGDIFGSNLFNLMIIGVLDLSQRDYALLASVSKDLLLPTLLSGLIAVLAAVFIVLHIAGMSFTTSILSLFSPSLLGFYFFTMFVLWRREYPSVKHRSAPITESDSKTLKGPLLLYLVSATAVVGAGFGLASSGETIADLTGWGSSFVGTFFVAMSTSLPELATCFAALKIGAKDLAIGNVIGSNLFNIGVVTFTDDLLYPGDVFGGFLGSISPVHLITVFAGIGMTATIWFTLALSSRRSRTRHLAPESIILLVIFLLANYLIFASAPMS
jgi:cation:H+ antiporter